MEADPPIVAPSLSKEDTTSGVLVKRGHFFKNWKSRYCILDGTTFSYYGVGFFVISVSLSSLPAVVQWGIGVDSFSDIFVACVCDPRPCLFSVCVCRAWSTSCAAEAPGARCTSLRTPACALSRARSARFCACDVWSHARAHTRSLFLSLTCTHPQTHTHKLAITST